MREIPVDDLAPVGKMAGYVLHRSGRRLVDRGEALSAEIISLLRADGMRSVFVVEGEESLASARLQLTHVAMPVADLKPGDHLARTVYDERGMLLIEAGTAIPRSFAKSLAARDIQTIYCRRPPEELDEVAGRKLRSRIEALLRGEPTDPRLGLAPPAVRLDIAKTNLPEAAPEDLRVESLRAKIDSMAALDYAPAGDPFAAKVRDRRGDGPVSKEEKRAFSSGTVESLRDIRRIFDNLKDGSPQSPLPDVDRVANWALEGLSGHRDLHLLCSTQSKGEEYLASHSLAMTAVAVSIGTSMGYGTGQIKALAYGAMLADVGLLRIPRQVLEKEGRLSPAERAEIHRHPAYGMDIIQRMRRIPEEVPYVVYQSHERANGSGYPCGKKDVVIHPFARIVAVADIYASVCAQRPYRPAQIPYKAMESIVLMAGKRELNPEVVRSFLACNSMFPVGSFVRLSDGSAGRIVAANPENFMKPVVSLLCEAGGQRLREPLRLDLLREGSLSVAQALAAEELGFGDDDLMLGF